VAAANGLRLEDAVNCAQRTLKPGLKVVKGPTEAPDVAWSAELPCGSGLSVTLPNYLSDLARACALEAL